VQRLFRDDSIVIHQDVEDRSPQMPGSGIEVPQLVFQLDPPGVVNTTVGRRCLRWRRDGSIEIACGATEQASLLSGGSSSR
jgi:hypothetical protein